MQDNKLRAPPNWNVGMLEPTFRTFRVAFFELKTHRKHLYADFSGHLHFDGP
jgi:hypothetical protein